MSTIASAVSAMSTTCMPAAVRVSLAKDLALRVVHKDPTRPYADMHRRPNNPPK